MASLAQYKSDELLSAWISMIISQFEAATHKSVSPQLHRDFDQFQAIKDQLDMLNAAKPALPWEVFSWRQNFDHFLLQTIRRTRKLLTHLSAELPSAYGGDLPYNESFLLNLASYLKQGLSLLPAARHSSKL